jgi:hypothetical protein
MKSDAGPALLYDISTARNEVDDLCNCNLQLFAKCLTLPEEPIKIKFRVSREAELTMQGRIREKRPEEDATYLHRPALQRY